MFAIVFAYCIFQVVWLIRSLVLFDAFPSCQRLCSLVSELQEVNDLERKRKKIRGCGRIFSSTPELEHKEVSVFSSEAPNNAEGGDVEEGDESQMTEVGDEQPSNCISTTLYATLPHDGILDSTRRQCSAIPMLHCGWSSADGEKGHQVPCSGSSLQSKTVLSRSTLFQISGSRLGACAPLPPPPPPVHSVRATLIRHL